MASPRPALHRTAAATFVPVSSTPAWSDFRDRWPNADHSVFIDAGGLHWHVQRAGNGPAIVLLHGSGAATHTWRDVLPRLAAHGTVCAMDLPGHGFTTGATAAHLTLPAMAMAVREVLRVLDVVPRVLVGHSAGAAVALELATDWPSVDVVGINAALAPPHPAMSMLTPAVGWLARAGLTGVLTAKLAENDAVFDALMRSTGSNIDASQLALYRVFAMSPRHASAVMTMFAQWELTALLSRLPTMRNRVSLIIGARDAWVPPSDTVRIARALANVRVVELADAGHVAHEEHPARVCELIEAAAAAQESPPPA